MYLVSSNQHTAIRESLTYVNWTRKEVPLPVTFTISDRRELEIARTKHLFVRKVNSQTSSELLDWIDTNWLSESDLQPSEMTD